MKPNQITLAKILTYSGTLPFIVSAIHSCFPFTEIDSSTIARTYSAIIISFLCGIHWAVHVFFSQKCPRNLLMTSNVVALLAWAALLMPYPAIALLLQAFSFLYLLTLDSKLRAVGLLELWFYNLRRNATLIVVFCLTIIAGLS